MPTTIKIIHAEDFIRAQSDGTLDLSASRNLLRDIVARFDTAGLYHVLVDTRRADVRLSTTEISGLGVEVGTTLARDVKVALMVSLEEKINAGFFETVSRTYGANLRAFTDFESAITWLIMKE